MPPRPDRWRRVGRRACASARGWAVLLAIALGLGHAQGALPSTVPALPPLYLEERLLQLTNDERARAGVSVLEPQALPSRARMASFDVCMMNVCGRARTAPRVSVRPGKSLQT